MATYKDPVMAGFYKAQAEDAARRQAQANNIAQEAQRRQGEFYGRGPGSVNLDEMMKQRSEQMWREIMEKMRKDYAFDFGNHDYSFHQERQYSYTSPPRQQTQIDCWKILGIAAGSSEADINSAFRRLARTAHPDTGGTKEKFQELNAAKMQALRLIK